METKVVFFLVAHLAPFFSERDLCFCSWLFPSREIWENVPAGGAARTAPEQVGNARKSASHCGGALHGGPGTGKSYTLNLVRRELFEQILGWQQGGSLPSCDTASRDGRTIGWRYHPPWRWGWIGMGQAMASAKQKLLELCATTLQLEYGFS